MSKILAISKYINNLLAKSALKAKEAVIEKAGQIENTAEPIKVTSKQIEGYYKKYSKSFTPKPKRQKTKPKVEEVTELDIQLQKECDAFNKFRHVNVSEEVLKELEHNFVAKKQTVQNIILENKEGLEKEFIQKVKAIENPKQLAKVLRLYPLFAAEALNKKYETILLQAIKGKSVSLEAQKQIFKDDWKISDVYLELIKAVTEESKDPKVIKIERYLKANYDMDFVHLESLEEARKILKTVNLAEQNDIPIPKNIVISPFTSVQHNGLNMAHNMLDHTVIIRSKKEIDTTTEKAYKQLIHPNLQGLAQNLRAGDNAWFSTKDILHLYTHEFCHNKFYMEMLLPTRVKPIPAKYNETAKQVGIYAAKSRNELAAELKTKSILSSLNKKEEELLSYFE